MQNDAILEQSFARALAQHRAGHLAEAEQGYRGILEQCPSHSDALHLLGVIALQTGQIDPALALIQRAAALRPDVASYRNNLGLVLERAARDGEARAAFEAAIELDPQYAEAFNNLGQLLMRGDELVAAEECLRRAIELAPDYAEPRVNLGNLLKDCGELDEAIASYRRAIALRPDLSPLHSNLLLALHYHADCSAADLAREHRLWAERHVAPVARHGRHENDPQPGRRLRIGYVSPDLREHSIARFLLPILEAHDRARFEIFAYSDASRPDSVSALIRRNVDEWRETYTLSDHAVAESVRRDRIDILVDLAVHSGRNRLLAFASKPAPVQMTYLGYCSTTGVDAIDYRLTDRYLDPPDADLDHYAEQSIRLPACYWCYSAPQRAEGADFPVERRAGPPTFGCLNNFAKVTPATLRLWARLLLAVPSARLLLHARAGAQCRSAIDTLRRAGIDASRVNFVGRKPLAEYLSTYRDIDVALDPFPFGGGTTTCDALWMGVPVVTLAGRTAVSRAGSSLLTNAGLGHLVADSADRYVELGSALMRDRARLGAARAAQRFKLESSQVMDLKRFVRDLENAYRTAWQSWCAGRSIEQR